MTRPWQKLYNTSTPFDINVSTDTTLVDILDEACTKYSDKVAFSSFGQELSYKNVQTYGLQFAAYLQQELGIKKGDRVALMTPNVAAFPVALYGIVAAGAIQVNVNPSYTATELSHQLKDSDSDTIIIFTGSTPVLADALKTVSVKNIITLSVADCLAADLPNPPAAENIEITSTFAEAIIKGETLSFEKPNIDGNDILFLQYTGGTTGLSKGAALTHGNLVANIAQLKAFLGDNIAEDEIVITPIPMYHIFALMVNLLSYFTVGALNVLITNPRDMPAFVAELTKWKFTAITGVNTLYNGLTLTPGFDKVDFSGLKVAIGGGAAVQEAISNRWKSFTGQHICQGYGLSETSPIVSANPIPTEVFDGSIGTPVPSTDVVIRDDAGNDLPFGERGELCVKGPQVMAGYWRKDDPQNQTFCPDGYFKTGDIAVMSEQGILTIVDRKKDMVLVSGFNVYPNEVEAVVANMEGIIECVCIGVPDDNTGEAVKLFVTLGETDVSKEAIIAYCRENLTNYKVPKQVEFIEEIPKSAVGKILRRELR